MKNKAVGETEASCYSESYTVNMYSLYIKKYYETATLQEVTQKYQISVLAST